MRPESDQNLRKNVQIPQNSFPNPPQIRLPKLTGRLPKVTGRLPKLTGRLPKLTGQKTSFRMSKK